MVNRIVAEIMTLENLHFTCEKVEVSKMACVQAFGWMASLAWRLKLAYSSCKRNLPSKS